ncbi:MAG: TetR family transcriptional regulator [Geodermatophilaceae bacterium]|nr:TetR family transcriptional regulator [Geodermatophilaceae bacterium]MDQ3455585.1 TetR family transcriptional regulator [Actinomycetota bacterium]
MTPRAATDRAGAVRAAFVSLVAQHGFHGASMGAVAALAAVATGTAYVHYSSKEELLYSAYLDVKRKLGLAAAAAVDHDAPPQQRFEQLWQGVHDHLAADRDRARFLVQVDASPYAEAAHERAMAVDGDPLLAAATAPDMVELFLPLPPRVLYDLAIGPVVRLVAAGRDLDPEVLGTLRQACWQATTR